MKKPKSILFGYSKSPLQRLAVNIVNCLAEDEDRSGGQMAAVVIKRYAKRVINTSQDRELAGKLSEILKEE